MRSDYGWVPLPEANGHYCWDTEVSETKNGGTTDRQKKYEVLTPLDLSISSLKYVR